VEREFAIYFVELGRTDPFLRLFSTPKYRVDMQGNLYPNSFFLRVQLRYTNLTGLSGSEENETDQSAETEEAKG
jgi:hypothetical protein